METMVRRSPEMILAGVTGAIVLRAALWLTISPAWAYFIVVRLLPLWIAVELCLLVGTMLCAYAIASRKKMTLFGQRVPSQMSIVVCLVGALTLAIEATLWLYGLDAIF